MAFFTQLVGWDRSAGCGPPQRLRSTVQPGDPLGRAKRHLDRKRLQEVGDLQNMWLLLLLYVIVVGCFWRCCSPPVRWGLLDFMYADLHSSFFFLADILAVLFARCRQMSTWTSRVQWAMPDLNRELQSGLGNAGPQPGSSKADWAMPDLNQGAPKRTGQCRTSTGELRCGLGNAGPQPGSSKADWAMPDLNRGAPLRTGQRRTSAARRYVRRCVRNMSEKNVRKNVRRYVRRNVRKYVKRYVRRYVKRYVRRYVRNMSDKNVRRYVNRNVR